MAAPTTMKAVVIQAPQKVALVERPIPRAKAGEVVVKVDLAALCGSDLHIYRGYDGALGKEFILGHEFVGEVHEVGDGVKNFKLGDGVLCPFTISCGNCFFCNRDQTGRCTQSRVFGSVPLDGAQAEYVLVPLADSTLYHLPNDVPREIMLLCADIFPTGYFVAENAYKMLNEKERQHDNVAVVIGCGPVGLCAITAAKSFFKTVYAVDSITERLAEAKKHGAIALHLENDDVVQTLRDATEGRGVDVALEVVGAAAALDLAVKAVRNFGVISSCGMHTKEVQFSGPDLYNKNLRFQFGRCPVRAVFEPAVKLLSQHHDLFRHFIQHTRPIEDAPEYYKLFNERKVLKTVFKMKHDA
ncbi:hypothetical protein ACQY0O_002517 [Thecaphora frezii]